MKKVAIIISFILLTIILLTVTLFFIFNEKLPEGKQVLAADTLATKMLTAIHHEDYKNIEVLEWSFRNSHHYKWYKQEHKVEVSWDNNTVILNTKKPEKSTCFTDNKQTENSELIATATAYFNNDSFWLVAPHKIMDSGTERRIVKHNEKDALLVTYTSGGSTPGDSYLWILDENHFPTSFKMWTKIIPLGGVSATWSDWKSTKTGVQLPTKHKLSLFGMELDMGNVKAYNPKADALANQVLKAIKYEAYKNTRYLEWSFGGRRHFKWDKQQHIVDVSWDSIRVNLHPNNLEKSVVYINDSQQEVTDSILIKRAWNIFNNDSFWLVAPHKLFDNGTIRTIKKVDNKENLFVKYTTGGSTPGDSYLWILDDNYIPKSYKMYVPSMKMKGVTSTWEDWITTNSGALLPTSHSFKNGTVLSMGEVKGYK